MCVGEWVVFKILEHLALVVIVMAQVLNKKLIMHVYDVGKEDRIPQFLYIKDEGTVHLICVVKTFCALL